MPPGSYLLQIAWGLLAGNTERAMRWLGVLCAMVGTGFTAAAARRAFGRRAALVAGLFLALGPNLAVYAVEIRAYPIFLMWVGISSYCFVGTLQSSDATYHRWLAALTASLIAGAFTHFYGILFAGATLSALLVDGWRNGNQRWLATISGMVVALACFGLVPFVTAAVHMSSGRATDGTMLYAARGLVRMIYRLCSHPAVAASPASLILVLGGFALALIAAVCSAAGADRVRRGLVFLLLTAGAVVTTVAFVARGFDATNPSYNIWALPVVALLLSSLAATGASSKPILSRTGWAALTCLLIGSALSSVQLHRYPDAYAHGPQKRLIALLESLGTDKVMVLYDGDSDSDALGLTSFAVGFALGRELPQYKQLRGNSAFGPIEDTDPFPVMPDRPIAVLVRVRNTSGFEVASLLRSPRPPPLGVAELLKAKGWQTTSQNRFVGHITADVELLRYPG
jgi:uncharacterized membrane protein